MECELGCGRSMEEPLVLRIVLGDGKPKDMRACAVCAVDGGFYCAIHEQGKRHVQKRKYLCDQCIEERVEQLGFDTACRFYETFEQKLPKGVFQAEFMHFGLTTTLSMAFEGEFVDVRMILLKLLVSCAQLREQTEEEVMAAIIEAKSFTALLPSS